MKDKSGTVDGLVGRTYLPSIAEVMVELLLSKFKMPQMEAFDGTKDPMDHWETYNAYMQLHAVPNKIKCRTFSTTLKGSGRIWFGKLKVCFIGTFA